MENKQPTTQEEFEAEIKRRKNRRQKLRKKIKLLEDLKKKSEGGEKLSDKDKNRIKEMGVLEEELKQLQGPIPKPTGDEQQRPKSAPPAVTPSKARGRPNQASAKKETAAKMAKLDGPAGNGKGYAPASGKPDKPVPVTLSPAEEMRLRALVADKETGMKKLKESQGALKTEIQNLKAQRESERKEFADKLAKKDQEMQRKVDQAMRQPKTSQEKENLSSELISMRSTKMKLEAELQELRTTTLAHNDTIKQGLFNLRTGIFDNLEDLKKAQTQIAVLEDRCKRADRSQDELRRDLAEKIKESERIKESFKQTESALKSRINKKDKELQEALSRQKKLSASNEANNKNRRNDEATKAKKAAQEAEKAKLEAQKQLAEAQKKLKALSSESDEAKLEASKRSAETEKRLESKAQEAEKAKEKALDECRSLRGQLEKLRKENAAAGSSAEKERLVAELEATRKIAGEVEPLRQELNSAKGESEKWSKQLDETKAALKKAVKSEEDCRKQLTHQRDEVAGMHTEMSKIKSELSTATSNLEEEKASTASLRKELSSARIKMHEQKTSKAALPPTPTKKGRRKKATVPIPQPNAGALTKCLADYVDDGTSREAILVVVVMVFALVVGRVVL